MSKTRLYTEEQVIDFTMSMISQYEFGNKNIWNKELLKESLAFKDVIELPSDEEIKKEAFEYYKSNVGNLDREIGFRYACKWYREQLKQRQ